MSDEVEETTRVIIKDNSNPIISIGADDLMKFLRLIADEQGFEDRSLEAVQIIVEGKAVNTLPKIVFMVSSKPSIEVEQIEKPQVENSIEFHHIKQTIPNIDHSYYDKILSLDDCTQEEFEDYCNRFHYEPEETEETE